MNLHLPLSTQVLSGYPVGCESQCGLVSTVSACKMATGWNAPQGVEKVHTLCAGKPESDDRGNNISVKRLGTSLRDVLGAI